MEQLSFDFNYPHHPEVLKQRTEQNRLKLLYLAAIKEFSHTENWDSDLDRKVVRSKDALHKFERNMFEGGGVSSVDYDSSNREHQAI
jgi:hypothetical protein